jgi:hypothetical protein
MSRITERELIAPALKLLEQNGSLSTTDLIDKLRTLLNPNGDDLKKLKNRNDDSFSQKVRNLKSHNSFTGEKNEFVIYNNGIYTITEKGKIHIKNVHL